MRRGRKKSHAEKPSSFAGSRSPKAAPHSTEAEQGALACVLLDPQGTIAEAIDLFRTEEAFYEPRHRLIWREALGLHANGHPVDVLTLQQRLADAGMLEQAGGYPYLSALPDHAPTGLAFDYFAQVVVDRWRQRRMLDALREAAMWIYEADADTPTGQLIDRVEGHILAAAQLHQTRDIEPISGPVGRVLESLENYKRGVGLVDGVRTGLSYLDKVIGGLHAGEMTVLAARPSVGKTSLASTIINNVALVGKVPVGFFSLEMRSEDIALRLLCARTISSMHKIRTGCMPTRDHEKIKGDAPEVSAAPLYMDDTPSADILQLRARARRMQQRHGIKLVVIDYLQLAQAEEEDEVREITAISQGCKSMARELNIPVLVLSQLNREMEKDKKRLPQLSDLRGSGSIEQDADTVLMLYAKPQEKDDYEQCEKNGVFPVNIYVAKQRNGPITHVEMLFIKEQMKFADKFKYGTADGADRQMEQIQKDQKQLEDDGELL